MKKALSKELIESADEALSMKASTILEAHLQALLKQFLDNTGPQIAKKPYVFTANDYPEVDKVYKLWSTSGNNWWTLKFDAPKTKLCWVSLFGKDQWIQASEDNYQTYLDFFQGKSSGYYATDYEGAVTSDHEPTKNSPHSGQLFTEHDEPVPYKVYKMVSKINPDKWWGVKVVDKKWYVNYKYDPDSSNSSVYDWMIQFNSSDQYEKIFKEGNPEFYFTHFGENYV